MSVAKHRSAQRGEGQGMKVKDLLKQEIDIDVYDDVCDELAIAFCGPVELTDEGEEVFADVLDYEITLHNDVAIVGVDDDDGIWQKKLKKAKKLFYGMAGYCSIDNYRLWFK